MYRVLGLDLGIASIGWCVLDIDENKILGMNSHIFPSAENPKNGASLATPRREARAQRRLHKRRRDRKKEVTNLMLAEGLIKSWHSAKACLGAIPNEDGSPYDLRAKGLDELLNDFEWFRVLYHIASHRGYKSNRRTEEADETNICAEKQNEKKSSKDEIKKMLSTCDQNHSLVDGVNYRTAGEALAKHPKFAQAKRNHAGEFLASFRRNDYISEVHALFEAQRSFGNPHASKEFEDKYVAAMSFQRPFATGADILQKIGRCTLEPEEYRAPRAAYTSELFRLLGDINHYIRIVAEDPITGRAQERPLTGDERKSIIELAKSRKSDITYALIRKNLNLKDNESFSRFYGQPHDVEKKEKIKAFKAYHTLEKAFTDKEKEKLWEKIRCEPSLLDEIAEILSIEKTDDDITRKLTDSFERYHIPTEAINPLLYVAFSGFTNLSLKAMRNIIPYMMDGQVYSDACESAGYDFSGKVDFVKSDQLPVLEEYFGERVKLNNPVVRRTLTKMRKIINQANRRWGPFAEIHIEMAREMKKSFTERDKQKKANEQSAKFRDQLVAEMQEKFTQFATKHPSGTDILKYRLYKEQNGTCLYSRTQFNINQLFEDGYAEIDHILPYSRSFDNSLSNKVLVLNSENQKKGKRTPYEYLSSGSGAEWEAFRDFVEASHLSSRKKRNLLTIDFDDQKAKGWKDRNLTDTSYIARLARDYIQDTLVMADDAPPKAIKTLSGGITAKVRQEWGINSLKDREDDRHHALDAAVIAACGDGAVKRVTQCALERESYRYHADEDGKMHKAHVKEPYEGYRIDLQVRLSDDPQAKMTEVVMPSQYSEEEKLAISPIRTTMARTAKMRGQAHEETIRSVKTVQRLRPGYRGCISRLPLSKLTYESLEEMVGKETDPALYNALKARMKAVEPTVKDLKKIGMVAFGPKTEPMRKPTKDPHKMGPIVRSVRVYDKAFNGIVVRGGRAKNGDMVCVDVYEKDNKTFLVPQYVHNVVSGKMNDRAIVQGKELKDWTLIDEQYLFIGRLTPNTRISVTKKDNSKIEGYYRGVDISTGNIKFNTINKSAVQTTIGVKNSLLRIIEPSTLGV